MKIGVEIEWVIFLNPLISLKTSSDINCQPKTGLFDILTTVKLLVWYSGHDSVLKLNGPVFEGLGKMMANKLYVLD